MIKNEKLLQEFRKMKDTDFMPLSVEAFEKMLIDNIREEAAKANGSKNKFTLVKKVLKASEKAYNGNGLHADHAFLFSNPATLPDGTKLNCFSQGHYILASANDFGIPDAKVPYNMNLYFQDIPTKEKVVVDIADIKAFIKTKPKTKYNKNPYVIKYKNYLIGLDAEKLLDCLNFAGLDYFTFEPKKSLHGDYIVNPVYMANDETKEFALLLPCNLGNGATVDTRKADFVAA